jgi:hypothetical protein
MDHWIAGWGSGGAKPIVMFMDRFTLTDAVE